MTVELIIIVALVVGIPCLLGLMAFLAFQWGESEAENEEERRNAYTLEKQRDVYRPDSVSDAVKRMRSWK